MNKDRMNQEETKSLSKQRKLARKEELTRMKRTSRNKKIIALSVGTAIILGLGTFAGIRWHQSNNKAAEESDTTFTAESDNTSDANDDYSKYLSENGFIKGVTATSQITLADYKNLTVPYSEIEFTDQDVQDTIDSILDEFKTLDEDTTEAIKDGDTVNIDFVGSVDGEEFEGGSTEGGGYDLTIGSMEFIDDFEEQLIGHHVGEEVSVEVTFPEDYSNDPSLAGKEAVFEVTINGIYSYPEFNDAFVKENLSDNASTVEEYKNYLLEVGFEDNKDAWITNYLLENTTVLSYPEDYTQQLIAVEKYYNQSFFEYYQAYFGDDFTFEDFIGVSTEEYEAELKENAELEAKTALIFQAILETENVQVSAEDYKAYLLANGYTEDQYEEEISENGVGYSVQRMVEIKALDIIKDNLTIE